MGCSNSKSTSVTAMAKADEATPGSIKEAAENEAKQAKIQEKADLKAGKEAGERAEAEAAAKMVT
jgi:hypothetical protein